MGRPHDTDVWWPPAKTALIWWALLRQTISWGGGGQKKRFKDTLKKTLTSFDIDVTNWEVCAQDRPLWRSMIHTGARTAETIRIAEAQKKCAARKARLLYHQLFNRPDIPMPRVWKSADWLDTSTPTGSTKHDIIIIKEVMVIIGNDGRTTSSVYEWGKCIISITLPLSPFPHQFFLNMLYLIVNVWNKCFDWLIDWLRTYRLYF